MNALTVVSPDLPSLIQLPDERAAVALNDRIIAWNVIDEAHERSYAERGLIAIQFEKRSLWQYLEDPDTQTPFANMTAWMSCSRFLGCRRTNYESKRDMELLQDVPTDKLLDVKKSNLKVLQQLSTSVRNDPSVLEAAKTDKLLETIERDHPNQHIQTRKPIRINPERDGAAAIDKWVTYALEHDMAGSQTEAIVRACEMALHDAELDDELEAMAEAEKTEA